MQGILEGSNTIKTDPKRDKGRVGGGSVGKLITRGGGEKERLRLYEEFRRRTSNACEIYSKSDPENYTKME